MRLNHSLLAVVAVGLAYTRVDAEAPKAEPAPVTTTHNLRLGGKDITYTATAGTLPLTDSADKVTANVFYIAYTKSGEDLSKRPVTFTFNGGPGSSSVWLHMGAFGPRRALLDDKGEPLPPPARLVDNDLSLLDVTDLVFIDPVSTGLSRAAPGVEAKKFHGVQADVQAVADFIRLYITRNQRWASPRFLAGESYGTTRAAALAEHLQGEMGISLNGIILISAILNFQTARFDEGNDLPYVLFLPAYTATAWYHRRLSAELQADLTATLARAEKFAEEEYSVALLKGARLGDAERQRVAAKLAEFTGLSTEYLLRANLRPTMPRFAKELLRADARTVGRFDSRLTGIDRDAAGESPASDPSYFAVYSTYTAALNDHLRQSLKFESDSPYEILTGKVQPWDYGRAQNRYLNVAPALRTTMLHNRNLKVFLASGRYDLATPYFAADYTMNQLELPAELRNNITTAYYDAGHMMYVHRPSHEKLKQDLAGFYTAALRK